MTTGTGSSDPCADASARAASSWPGANEIEWPAMGGAHPCNANETCPGMGARLRFPEAESEAPSLSLSGAPRLPLDAKTTSGREGGADAQRRCWRRQPSDAPPRERIATALVLMPPTATVASCRPARNWLGASPRTATCTGSARSRPADLVQGPCGCDDGRRAILCACRKHACAAGQHGLDPQRRRGRVAERRSGECSSQRQHERCPVTVPACRKLIGGG